MDAAACILWHGPRSGGYGIVAHGRGTTRAHRHVYSECFGPIPDGYVLHHTCGEKLCINPAHLQPLTQADHMREHDNMERARTTALARKKARTHCDRGHSFAEHGYVRKPGSRDAGSRQCMACQRDRIRERVERRRSPLSPEAGYALSMDEARVYDVQVNEAGEAEPVADVIGEDE